MLNSSRIPITAGVLITLSVISSLTPFTATSLGVRIVNTNENWNIPTYKSRRAKQIGVP